MDAEEEGVTGRAEEQNRALARAAFSILAASREAALDGCSRVERQQSEPSGSNRINPSERHEGRRNPVAAPSPLQGLNLPWIHSQGSAAAHPGLLSAAASRLGKALEISGQSTNTRMQYWPRFQQQRPSTFLRTHLVPLRAILAQRAN
jgi:hypothetical protein